VQLLPPRRSGLPAILVQIRGLPRGLLTEWGTTLPLATKLRVIDSTADYRWMVLPVRPRGTDEWPEERLAGLVRDGDMIGVTVPRV
jgi:hypothetical protein